MQLVLPQVASLRAQLEFQTTEMRQSSEQEVGTGLNVVSTGIHTLFPYVVSTGSTHGAFRR